jgi:hypothetical protein
LAKAVFNIPQTDMLIERLGVDKSLRRSCGWPRLGALPSGFMFSQAFAAFSANALPSRINDTLIKKIHEDRLVGHISRDATAIPIPLSVINGKNSSDTLARPGSSRTYNLSNATSMTFSSRSTANGLLQKGI